MPKKKLQLARSNKALTNKFLLTISDYETANPGKLSVGSIVLSLVATWKHLFNALPEPGQPRLDKTPGSISPPPRPRDVVTA